jgi:hypothetical protein
MTPHIDYLGSLIEIKSIPWGWCQGWIHINYKAWHWYPIGLKHNASLVSTSTNGRLSRPAGGAFDTPLVRRQSRTIPNRKTFHHLEWFQCNKIIVDNTLGI